MRLLITGSSGQIGTNLALRLQQEGHLHWPRNQLSEVEPDRLTGTVPAYPTSPGVGRSVMFHVFLHFGFMAEEVNKDG